AKSERQKKAKLIFAGLFKTLNDERSDVMRGIERYARKQKEFSDQIRSAILQLRELQDRPDADQGRRRTDQSRGMGHAYLRGAPQDDELRLRSARSHRATAVRARPCDPAIARVSCHGPGAPVSMKLRSLILQRFLDGVSKKTLPLGPSSLLKNPRQN